ncbi:MAG: hypothetical protein VR71_18555 [Roseovarius sp. BRH_c41]|nr:MAG: hypothetical protein VR71_18555 [Roseovarius sp. BRH_c41]
MPGIILAKNPCDDCRLLWNDIALAGDRRAIGVERAGHAIAIADPARRFAFAGATLQPPVGLLGEVFDEQRRHRALQADMDLADLPLRDRHNRNAKILHLFVEGGDVLLIPADPVEAFGNHDINFAVACILEQALIAGPHQRGTGNACIRIGQRQHPTPIGDQPLANALLILDRGIGLQVGGIPGIGGRAEGLWGHQFSPPLWRVDLRYPLVLPAVPTSARAEQGKHAGHFGAWQ